jgi:GAF domain-containing protein/HAMP domain-containing protein
MKAKTKNPPTSRSLTTTLAIAFLALSVVTLLISGALQIFLNIVTQQEAIAEKLQLTAQDAGQSVSSFIEEKFNIIETAVNLVDIMRMTPDEQQLVLARLLGRDDELVFRHIAVLNAQGRELATASRLSEQAAAHLAEQISGDALVQIRQGALYFSAIYIDPNTSEPLILIGMPIVDAFKDFEGVLAAELNLKFMWNFIDQIEIGESGTAYVVDKLGNLIAYNDTSRVLQGENVGNLSNVRKFIQGADPKSKAAGELFTGIQRVTVVGTYAPLGRPDWAVVVELPWEEAYREVLRNGLASVMILVVLAVLASLVGVYVARRLSVPLISLTNTAAQISAGKLQMQANVRGPTEVAQLATSFNSMTTQLRSLISSLEERVESRTAQLRASAEVGRAVTSILEPDQLLKQVANLITERFGFYYVAVFARDEKSQRAVLRAGTGEAGRTLLERGYHLPINEQSMVGAAILTRSARIALDVGEGAIRFANPLLPNTRSEIALPLRVGDRILGALDVQSEQVGAFDEASAEVLQIMADQIAVALFNAETFKHSERQAQTLTLLNQLSRNLATATSLEDVATSVMSTVVGLLGPQQLAVTQKTANPQILALREFTGDPDQPVGDVQSIQTANSLIGACLERGETIYTPDLSTLVSEYSDIVAFYRSGQRSAVILPLHVGDRSLGTFSVGGENPDAYSAEQINQLEQIASQLAITIENLNLAEQTQQTLAELDTANRRLIGQAWDQHTRTTRLVAAEWRNGQWTVSSKRTSPPETARAEVAGPQALSLPIKVRGTTIGEFNITATETDLVWDPEEKDFAQALIDQVGQVLENARLIDETERLAQREKAVADAADKIHRSTDIESVLHSAVAELRRITGRNGISVQLGFGRADRASSHPVEAEGDR